MSNACNEPDAELDEELEHDDECTCDRCERMAIHDAILDAEARAQRMIAARGISAWGHEVLGAGWVDGDGKGGNVIAVSTEELAQRALGDVFEQLGRIATVGREKCRGAIYATAPLTRAQLVKRHEVVHLLRFCENVLDYARVHLDYLDLGEPERLDDEDVCEPGDEKRAEVVAEASP